MERYKNWYAKLLRLYPKAYRERFEEGMAQTFNDLCRERQTAERRVFGFVLRIFVETSAGIIRENIAMPGKNIIIRSAFKSGLLLLLPLMAMQFTSEVAWDLADFVVAGTLLFGTGLTYELVAKKMGSIAYRFAVGIALVAVLVLVWTNLAVGIIGPEGNPANLMYIGVLAVGIIGAIIARFQPHGMARALFAMALAQALVAMITLIAGMHRYSESSVPEILLFNGFFIALFLGSAWLFQHVARSNNKPGVNNFK